jgi:formamidopyrimidine-DNA glycosylase
MPELPEVETIIAGIKGHVLNNSITDVIVREFKLRWPVPQNLQKNLQNTFFSAITRRGKYFLLSTELGTLILHLGMSGRLILLPSSHKYGYHEHVIINFANDKSLCFFDPRKFGAVLWADGNPYEHSLLVDLGVEPLSEEFTGEYLYQKIQKRKVPIKQFLMDSKIVVGIGNIYATEVLFLSKINPLRLAKDVLEAECNVLVPIIKSVLKMAIAKGGTTIRDYVQGDGKSGNFQNYLKAYGRAGKPCVNCKTPLKEIRLGERSTVYCACCQSK